MICNIKVMNTCYFQVFPRKTKKKIKVASGENSLEKLNRICGMFMRSRPLHISNRERDLSMQFKELALKQDDFTFVRYTWHPRTYWIIHVTQHWVILEQKIVVWASNRLEVCLSGCWWLVSWFPVSWPVYLVSRVTWLTNLKAWFYQLSNLELKYVKFGFSVYFRFC